LLGPEDDIVASALAVSQYYKDDPVHLSEAGYTDLCTQLVEKMMNTNFKRVKVATSAAKTDPQIDWAARRSKWAWEMIRVFTGLTHLVLEAGRTEVEAGGYQEAVAV
jgi:hypothetical protein